MAEHYKTWRMVHHTIQPHQPTTITIQPTHTTPRNHTTPITPQLHHHNTTTPNLPTTPLHPTSPQHHCILFTLLSIWASFDLSALRIRRICHPASLYYTKPICVCVHLCDCVYLLGGKCAKVCVRGSLWLCFFLCILHSFSLSNPDQTVPVLHSIKVLVSIHKCVYVPTYTPT